MHHYCKLGLKLGINWTATVTQNWDGGLVNIRWETGDFAPRNATREYLVPASIRWSTFVPFAAPPLLM